MKGLIGGLAGLLALWLSMHVLSRSLERLPWTRLAAPHQPLPAVAPIPERVASPERVLLPGHRGVAGSVPLYRESRPRPAWTRRSPEPEPEGPPPQPPQAAASRRPAPPQASVQTPAQRFKLDSLPAMGEAFGAPASPQGQGQAAAGGGQSRSDAALPAGGFNEPEAPAQGAWDQGPVEPAQAPQQPKARRPMRALPQGGVVLPAQQAPEEPEPYEAEPE